MPKHPPFPWRELAKSMPDKYKYPRDPQEMAAAKVSVVPPSVSSSQRNTKLEPLTPQQQAEVREIEDYFSLKDLVVKSASGDASSHQ